MTRCGCFMGSPTRWLFSHCPFRAYPCGSAPPERLPFSRMLRGCLSLNFISAYYMHSPIKPPQRLSYNPAAVILPLPLSRYLVLPPLPQGQTKPLHPRGVRAKGRSRYYYGTRASKTQCHLVERRKKKKKKSHVRMGRETVNFSPEVSQLRLFGLYRVNTTLTLHPVRRN